MSTYEIVMTIHLLGVAAIAGSHGATVVLHNTLRSTKDVEQSLRLGARMARIEQTVINPASLATIASGLWLVHLTSYGYADPWLLASYALLVLVAVVAGVVLGPAAKQLKQRATELREAGETSSDKLAQLASAPKVANTIHVMTTAIAVLIVLMAIRPGA